MSAIKLPVRAYAQTYPEGWSIRADDSVRVGRDLTEDQAKQIALALNLHNDLVSAATRFIKVESVCTKLRITSCGAKLDAAENELIEAHMELKSVLARAETANETKT